MCKLTVNELLTAISSYMEEEAEEEAEEGGWGGEADRGNCERYMRVRANICARACVVTFVRARGCTPVVGRGKGGGRRGKGGIYIPTPLNARHIGTHLWFFGAYNVSQ